MDHKRSLGKRLKAAADFVKPGRMVVDVGTDHAYLPIYLVQNNLSKKVYASDVAEKPLAFAQENIEKCGLQNEIELILSDGLKAINPIAVDTIIIAGMGGQTIIKILDESPWIQADDIHLILQPMTGAKDLRTYLYKTGFYIDKERPVVEHGKVYSVMSVHYDVSRENITEVYSYIGKTPFYETTDREHYLRHVLKQLEKKYKGLEKAVQERNKKELRRLRRTITSVKQILKGIESNGNSE